MMANFDDRLPVTAAVKIPRHELTFSFSPSGGPGGQHANKAATRVSITFVVETSAAFNDRQRQQVLDKLGPVVRVVSDSERSQYRNRQEAEKRLAQRVRSALHVPTKRRPTKPSRGSQKRRLSAKSRRSQLKKSRRQPSVDD